jgi:hypothetical protein
VARATARPETAAREGRSDGRETVVIEAAISISPSR